MTEQINRIRKVLETLNNSFPSQEVDEAIAALSEVEEHVQELDKMWDEYQDYLSIR